MVKLLALYKKPENMEAFMQHYSEVHMPLTMKMPNLMKVECTQFTSTPMGGEAPYFMQAELYFKDMETLQASMSSPEGRTAAKDLMSFAGSCVTMVMGEVSMDHCCEHVG